MNGSNPLDLVCGLLGLSATGLFSILCMAVPVAMVFALIYVLRKTKEEEAAMKIELQEIVNSLPNEKQASFFLQYNAQAKNPTTAVVLAILLGGIGAHKFYMGNIGLGILYLVFSWTGIPLIIGIIEGFTISRTVFKKNREIARETSAMLSGNVASMFN